MADRLCTTPGCDRPYKAKGLCSNHYNRAYYQRDPQRHRARAKRWYDANPGRAAETRGRRDPDRMREYARAYYREHRLGYVAHAANRRARVAGVPGVLTADAIAARIVYFGGRCWVCGESGADSIDHVKPLGKGGMNIPANIRPACGSCNFARSWEGRR